MGRANLSRNPSCALDTTWWVGGLGWTQLTGQTVGTTGKTTAGRVTVPASAYPNIGQAGSIAATDASAAGRAVSYVAVVRSSVDRTYDHSLSKYNGTAYQSMAVATTRVTLTANTWTVVRGTGTVAAGGTYDRIGLHNDLPTGVAGTLDVAAVRIELDVTDATMAPADGDTAGWVWDGTAGASTSQESAVQTTQATVREALSGSGYTSGGQSTRTLVTGAGTKAGDLLVAFVGADYVAAGAAVGTPTGTAGTWSPQTVITNNSGASGPAQRPTLGIFTRPVTVDGAQTVTVTMPAAAGDTAVHLALYVVKDEAANPVLGATSVYGSSDSSGAAAPSQPGAVGALLLAGWQSSFASSSTTSNNGYTPPASMTGARTTPVADNSVMDVAQEQLTSSGATGARTATRRSTSARAFRAASITIAPAAAATQQGAAALGSTTTLAAGAQQGQAATAALGSTTTLASGAMLAQRAAAALSSSTTLSAAATRAQPAAAALGSSTTLTAGSAVDARAAAAVGSTTVLTAQAGQQAAAALSSSTVLSAGARQTHGAAAALGSTTVLAAAAQQTHRAAAALSSTTVLAVSATRVQPAAAALGSTTVLAAVGTRVKLGSAALGSSTVLAVGYVLRTAVVSAALSSSTTIIARASAAAGGALNPSLWALDPGTGRLVALPHTVKLEVHDVENDVGAISCEYPVWGRRFGLLEERVTDERDLEVEVWLEGARSTRMVGRLDQRQGDDVTEGTVWSFSGTLITIRLDEITVAPQPLVGETTLGADVEVLKASVTSAQWSRLYALGYRTSDAEPDKMRVPQKVIDAVKANAVAIPQLADPKREAKFAAATPGSIMLFLLGQAWARGAGTDLTVDFTATKDSAGVAWPELFTGKWSPGVTLLQVAQRLVELGLLEFTVTPDRVLRCWRFGGRGTDRTGGARPTTLRRGENLLEAGRRQGVRGAGTRFFVAGGEGAYTTVEDLNAQARRGRVVEVATSVGNITDPGALSAAGQRLAVAGARGQDERSLNMAQGVGMPRPGKSFGVGDRVRVDTAGQLGSERIAQWTVTLDRQAITAQATAGDLIRSRAAALAKRLADQQSGETVIGTSQPSEDRGVPVAPTGLVVSSRAFTENADAYAAVTAGWSAVQVNTDGTATTDLDAYEVQWCRESEQSVWIDAVTVAATQTTGSFTTSIDLPIRVRVRARDRAGNRSQWSEQVLHLTDDNLTPPPVPSALTGEAWLGNSIRWRWDGLTAAGGDMLTVFPRFDHVELRMGTSASFADSVLIERLYAGTTWTVTNLPDGVRQYAWLVAVERGGLRSEPSARADALPRRLVSIDFGPDSVDRAAIKALAVGNLQLDNGAVNSLKVTELNVALLTGGVLSADVIMGGNIMTATTGRRVRIGNDGVMLYNAAGDPVVAFKTADASALITGQIQTALTGPRMVLNWGNSNPAEMRFYPATTNMFASMGPVTSVALGYENQAGINMKAYSGRTDKQSGEVAVFPSYASISWSNERGGGVITARIAASEAENFHGGARHRMVADPANGSDFRGAWSAGFDQGPNSSWADNPTALTISDGSNNGTGNARLRSFANNSGIQFDRGNGEGIISMVRTDGSLCRMQAANYALSSSRAIKQAIRALRGGGADTLDPLAVIAAARGRSYQMRNGGTERQVGLIAEELPALLRGPTRAKGDAGSPGEDGAAGTVDLYAVVTTVWEAVAQLKEDMDLMRSGRR